MTKVSVISPAFNTGKTVGKVIGSVLEQRNPMGKPYGPDELEILVVDDGGRDNTSEIVRELAKVDSRVKLLNSPNAGNPGHSANNYGILHSDGDYVVRMDSDGDHFLPGYIAATKTILDYNPSIDFVHSNYEEFFINTGELVEVDSGENIFNSIADGMMYRRSLLAKTGIYDPSFFFAEYDLLHRVLKSGAVREHIPKPLFRYIRHPASATGAKERVEMGRKQLFEKWGKFPMRDY